MDSKVEKKVKEEITKDWNNEKIIIMAQGWLRGHC